MSFAFGSNLPPEDGELGWVFGIADGEGTTERAATEADTDDFVLVIDTLGAGAPPSVEAGTNTPPLVVVGLTEADEELEDPDAAEDSMGAAE